MKKVNIVEDEWYPFYFVFDDDDDGCRAAMIDDALYQEYKDVMARMETIQQKLKMLTND